MTVPTLSVVIPAYNAATTIADQLQALIQQESAPPFEVVVADNRSTDDTAAVALCFSDRLDLRVIPAFERQGVNHARNAGTAASRGQIVVLVDADDRVLPTTLAAFAASFADAPDLGIAGGTFTSQDSPSYQLERAQGYLPYVPGGIMAYRRTVFDAIGGFDEAFRGGHDEADYCWRAQQAGFKITLSRGARIDRRERPTQRGAFTQYRRFGATYIQLWVKHREHGIPGSSARTEIRGIPGAFYQIRRLMSKDQATRLDASKSLGWFIGRWQGFLRYRAWGPR